MSNDLVQLCWRDFGTHISGALKNLRNDDSLCDITLVCEDGVIRAHRVILSACSSFFCRVVGNTYYHIHPLLYLRGVCTRVLANIVDYMYMGVVKVRQEDLSDLLRLASDLKVHGLTTSTQQETPENENSYEVPSTEVVIKKKMMKRVLEEVSNKSADMNKLVSVEVAADVGEDNEAEDGNSEIEEDSTSEIEDGSEMEVGSANTAEDSEEEDGSRDEEENISVLKLKEDKKKPSVNDINLEAPPHDDTNKEKILDEMVDTLVIRTKTKLGVSYECRVCNKTLKEKNLIRRHAETHIKGFSHMCDYCGKFYKNRASLRVHMSISHKQCKTEELEDGHSSQ